MISVSKEMLLTEINDLKKELEDHNKRIERLEKIYENTKRNVETMLLHNGVRSGDKNV